MPSDNAKNPRRAQTADTVRGHAAAPIPPKEIRTAPRTEKTVDNIEALLQESLVRCPLSARRLSEEKRLSFDDVANAFRRLAEQRCNVFVCDDPLRHDCLLDLA